MPDSPPATRTLRCYRSHQLTNWFIVYLFYPNLFPSQINIISSKKANAPLTQICTRLNELQKARTIYFKEINSIRLALYGVNLQNSLPSGFKEETYDAIPLLHKSYSFTVVYPADLVNIYHALTVDSLRLSTSTPTSRLGIYPLLLISPSEYSCVLFHSPHFFVSMYYVYSVMLKSSSAVKYQFDYLQEPLSPLHLRLTLSTTNM